MIISDKYKCIFIRIPKTGTTSFQYMWQKIDPDARLGINEPRPPYGHQTASQLRKIVGEKKWKEYFKFTFVREPLSWFKSQYMDHAEWSYKKYPELSILLNKDHKLNWPEEDKKDNVRKINFNDTILFYVFLLKWNKFESIKNFIDEDIDFIGKLENFEQDIEKIRNILNIKDEFNILHKNKSQSSTTGFTEKTTRLLNVILEDDIKFYNSLS